MAATAAIFILTSAMMLPVFFTNVLAADTSLPKGYVTMDKVFRLEDGDGSQPVHYSKVDGFYLVLTHIESRSFHIAGDAVYGAEPVVSEYQSASQTISDKPAFTVTRTENATGFTVSGTYDWKHTYGYGSIDSFTKAFTRFHGATPTAVRKNGCPIKSYAPLKLEIFVKGGYIMDYKIEKRKALRYWVRQKGSIMRIARRKSRCSGRNILSRARASMFAESSV